MQARIFPAAEARLLEIWDYTLERWGEEQADCYVRDLIHRINALSNERHRWRPLADKQIPGVWFVRHEHHFVFFREFTSGCIGVISILHEKMDLPARVKEDAIRSEETPPPSAT